MTDYERGVEQASKIYREVINEYVAENAKLWELVQEAVDAASLKDIKDWRYGKRLAFLRKARELGIVKEEEKYEQEEKETQA